MVEENKLIEAQSKYLLQLKGKDNSVQLSEVQNIEINMWKRSLSFGINKLTFYQLQLKQPPAAYSAVVSAFKNKLSYFMITIPNIRAANWYL